MEAEPKTAQHQDNGKKPYEAPELMVMGNATEMTQAGIDPITDGLVSDTAS